MKYESALELQARVFSRVFDFQPIAMGAGDGLLDPHMLVDPIVFEASALSFRAARAARAKRSDRQRAADDIALGITDGKGDEEAKLAVLVQDRRKLRHPVVESIAEMARGEMELIYIGRQRALWTRSRVSPLRIGCSISPVTSVSAGTLGCFCRDTSGGPNSILSNNHVIADVNRAPPATRIVQPGRLDGGVSGADDIAELTRFVPIQFGGVPNGVDAAMARLLDHGRGEDRVGIFDCAEPPVQRNTFQPSNPAAATLEMRVHKTGRTTCFTTGRVRAVNVNNYMVNYPGVGMARFDGQITIEMDMSPARPFARPGDSGSIVVDEEGRPVGLLFAGSASGGPGNVGITAVNPISSVMAQLGINLI